MARAQRILIVEDDEDLRRMIRRALVVAGYAVQEAGNGLHALQQIDVNPPDAVILDLGLPIISGQTVRAEIAAHAHWQETKRLRFVRHSTSETSERKGLETTDQE